MTLSTRRTRSAFPTASGLLLHILDSPALIKAVRELPAPMLRSLVDSVGLEDAGELVALASTEQLEAVFDDDLWTAGSDWEDRFDATRFALWLHAFSEAGDTRLVERLAELPVDLLALAVARLVLVLDIESLAVDFSQGGEDLEQTEKALDSVLCEEWEEFRLISRDETAWGYVIHALFALDRDHHALLRRILERCAAMSSEWIEDNGGLYEVLSSDEMLEADVRGERDDRRASKGFVSRPDARAFLELARTEDPTDRDPITRAYFRELVPTVAEPGSSGRRVRQAPARRASVVRLMKALEEAGIVETKPTSPRQLPGATSDARAAVSDRGQHRRLLDATLGQLATSHPEIHAERLEELAYLANVLTAASEQSRHRLRPVEALEAAVIVTNFGLERAIGETGSRRRAEATVAAEAVLRATRADQVFRRAWRALCSGSGSDLKVTVQPGGGTREPATA